MTRGQRYEKILEWFKQNMPEAKSELNYNSPYQLLVAVMLSAQCTDKRVNMVTPALFRAYPDPHALSTATPEEVLKYISSISYPNSKAAHLVAMAQKLCNDFGGEIPRSVTELESLPGVGHKTANVMVAVCFGGQAMPVDTHVFRVSRRLGLSSGTTVGTVEKDLVKHIPAELLGTAHHWLLLHGRYVCTSRKSACESCALTAWCKEYADNNKLKKQI